MRSIRLENVSKSFGDECVLDGINLTMPSGKFFALLGPSGCGKTTILRLIAGLEKSDSGRIFLGDEDITKQPVFRRKINTVFQNYALFPHLTVFENVAYGLRIKNVKELEIYDRVLAQLKSTRLLGCQKKMPSMLSGGQKQRVALARALVGKPEVILFDEPLAALDVKLKERVLVELMELQYELKTTFVYVTHDQAEALTIADKMAIINFDGSIAQIGTPEEIYEFPVSTFVADFVGSTNILEGILHKRNEADFFIDVEAVGVVDLHVEKLKNWIIPGGAVYASIRPEKIEISKTKLSEFSCCFPGVVESTSYAGRFTQYQVNIANGQVVSVFEQNEEHFPKETINDDDQVFLHFQKDNVVLLER
ncbi:ABC transporter ATP-binding protein [Candidatus Babeliales bacterium]|nr:ABC transporter ATP-binding protein [Candidatus Babeliales bacterium]